MTREGYTVRDNTTSPMVLFTSNQRLFACQKVPLDCVISSFISSHTTYKVIPVPRSPLSVPDRRGPQVLITDKVRESCVKRDTRLELFITLELFILTYLLTLL